MKLKVVIFDFDGVIFDSWQGNYKIIKFLSKFSDYNEEEILKMWGMGGESFVKILTKKFPWPIDYLIQRFVYFCWRFQEIRRNSQNKFFNETLEVIEKLKTNNFLVGIMTNRTSKTLKIVLEKLPNPPDYYFDFIQTNEPSKKKKTNLNCKNQINSEHSKPQTNAFIDFFCNFLFNKIEKNRINDNFPEIELVYLGDTLTDLEFIKRCNANIGLKINFYGVLTGPLNSKEKWIQWSNGQINEENILTSTTELLNKLKIPQ